MILYILYMINIIYDYAEPFWSTLGTQLCRQFSLEQYKPTQLRIFKPSKEHFLIHPSCLIKIWGKSVLGFIKLLRILLFPQPSLFMPGRCFCVFNVLCHITLLLNLDNAMLFNTNWFCVVGRNNGESTAEKLSLLPSFAVRMKNGCGVLSLPRSCDCSHNDILSELLCSTVFYKGDNWTNIWSHQS